MPSTLPVVSGRSAKFQLSQAHVVKTMAKSHPLTLPLLLVMSLTFFSLFASSGPGFLGHSDVLVVRYYLAALNNRSDLGTAWKLGLGDWSWL